MYSKIIWVSFFGLLLSSCKVMSPRAYEAMLHTQDSLNQGWRKAQIENGHLEDRLANLKADTASLARRLNSLQQHLSSSSNEVKQLAAHLEERERRLKEVENALHKREEANRVLKGKLQRALLSFEKSGLTVEMRSGKVYVRLTDKLLFPSGSIVINQQGQQALAELAKVLNAQPDINITVEGHTDDQPVKNLGQMKDNWDLSVLRSTSVVRFLTEKEDVDPRRLVASGRSEYSPMDTADTPEARGVNRRIEIILSPQLDELYKMIK